jgi:hypothetical protein
MIIKLSIVTNCALAFGLFLGICGYHFVVNGAIGRGALTGLVAAGLLLLVRGVIGLLRRKQPARPKSCGK